MERIDPLFNKAQKYLRSSALLLEMEDFDSSVSRAYFAMFYSSQAALMHNGGGLPTRQSIRGAFRDRYIETGVLPQHAGRVLPEAADLQEMADQAHGITNDRFTEERKLK